MYDNLTRTNLEFAHREAEKRIAELEKENAVLKSIAEFQQSSNMTTHDEQLTKAKEIIEELYNIIPASMSDYAKEPMEHARKFMSEE